MCLKHIELNWDHMGGQVAYTYIHVIAIMKIFYFSRIPRYFYMISWDPALNQARGQKTENFLRSKVQDSKTFDVILIINQTVVNMS